MGGDSTAARATGAFLGSAGVAAAGEAAGAGRSARATARAECATGTANAEGTTGSLPLPASQARMAQREYLQPQGMAGF
jgi:hypothetical protein